MVWGLFPAEPLSGENRYYIFSKGTYKVGRKGCDVIINKDKGVSRVHAEIVVDAMIALDTQRNASRLATKVRIRDCSKYGTFINKDLVSKKKVHEFPSRETTLQDGDLVSFGTGNATYRFSFVPFKFSVCCSVPFQTLQDKISLIGASAIRNWSMECTHVLLDDITLFNVDVVDAIVGKKPLVCHKWVEFIAELNICTEIPCCSSHAPTLKVEDLSVKFADSVSRENCLRGYTFLLESALKYQLKDRLNDLLEVSGAKVIAVEAFYQSNQGSEGEGNERIALVTPAGSGDGSESFRHLSSLLRVNEIHLIRATLSGQLDPSILVLPPVVITSSCSTDETVVADSDEEIETAASIPNSVALDTTKIEESESKRKANDFIVMSDQGDEGHISDTNIESLHNESMEDIITNHGNERVETSGQMACSEDRFCSKVTRGMKDEDTKNSDIIYSQDLVIKDLKLPAKGLSSRNNTVINFKRFRKMEMQSGNSFYNLIPFAKNPYKDSDYGNEEVAESIKEEKRRKQMEAVADDLFNNEKGKKRGTAGSLHGLFTRR
ncbi:nijmegen breakage syndrome 1 protein [Heracleum sosnowskyi]|uniref:Nijmegen breakage syndrome 1 protein n=1 Tax=Heracleum sosnowskyi TaxID=360622 RepID=A0AAD8M7B6_9APIA|nr:nijmegen breakage syndrome 1 protein [Heracleum sosnowskyi]